MAYIVSVTQTATASAASYTVTLGSHQSGDLLLVYLSQDGGGTAIAPDATSTTAGWAMIGTGAASGASRSQWAYLIADSSSEVNPVFTGANDDWIGTCLVIRDAHATAPFGTLVDGTDFKRYDWNNVGSHSMGSLLTSAVDECLLLYSWNADGATQYMRAGWTQCCEVDKYVTANINHIIGCRQQQTAAAAPTVTMYNINATEGGNGWILAIRNKTGGALQPDVRVTGSELKFYGPWSSTHDSVTWEAPSAFAASINSITCGSTSPTVTANNLWPEETYGQYTNVSLANSTAGEWAGGTHTISSTDMTGKVFSVQCAMSSSSNNTQIGTDGLLIGFSDGTNWVVYQIATREKGWNALAVTRAAIALGQATAYASSGSINWGAVTRIGYFYHRVGSVITATAWTLKNPTLVSKVEFTGGGSDRPLILQDLDQYIYSFSQYKHTRIQSSAQIQIPYSFQIGDGTNKTYFDGAAQSLEFPQEWSSARVRNWQMDWNVNPSQLSLSVKASASDTIKLAAGVAATDTLQALTIDSSSSTSATYDFAQSFVGWAPTWKTGVACIGATFSGCDPVDFKGASPTNIIVKNTLAGASEGAISFDANGATLTTSTISCAQDSSLGGNCGYHISLGASVTSITLNGNTFTGTPGTDKIYSAFPETTVASTALVTGTRYKIKTAGTTVWTSVGAANNNVGTEFTATGTAAGTGDAYAGVTITWDGNGTSITSADVTTTGANVPVYIAAPTVNQEVVVSGFTVGSRIQIYDVTSATELFNGTASAGNTVVSGSTATWTDPAAATSSRAIRVRISYVSGATADLFQELSGLTCGTTLGTESVTYPVTPEDDVVYNANGIDGPAIYATSGITFTDAATDLINCNIGGGTVSWATIYACFVHWLNTSTGIDDDVTYIDAVDTANYLLTSMKIRNTSATPLTVTGGWGRDSTTLTIADCIDVAGSTGNIYPLPDHVVAYATGSGLTAGEAAQLATAATSSAQAVTDIAALPTAAEISTQVLSDASSTPIASNIKQVNDVTVTGTGADNDTWGPA